MLLQSGLYYPYIHVRNDAWLKAAALYWKRVDRIVPHDYPTHDSLTVKMLTDELGFIKGHHPGQAAVDASRLFLDLLADRGSGLSRRLQVQPSNGDLRRHHEHPSDGGISSTGTVGYIFAEKLSAELIDALADQGLAFGASAERDGRHRMSLNYGSANWIGMDSRLAATYMTVLTRLTAHRFDLNPVTDVSIAHTAMEGLDVDSIADALIGPRVAPRDNSRIHVQQRVALLAIQSVLPRGLGSLDTREIIRFRKSHEDSLAAFQSATAAAAAEIAHLPPDVDAGVVGRVG